MNKTRCLMREYVAHGATERSERQGRTTGLPPPCGVGNLSAGAPLTYSNRAYASSTASAPFTASALSVTVFSSEVACTAMFSAKNRASAT
jgi:hypothetical protein